MVSHIACAKHKVENGDQTCLLEHDVTSQHDGADTRVAAEQYQEDVDT